MNEERLSQDVFKVSTVFIWEIVSDFLFDHIVLSSPNTLFFNYKLVIQCNWQLVDDFRQMKKLLDKKNDNWVDLCVLRLCWKGGNDYYLYNREVIKGAPVALLAPVKTGAQGEITRSAKCRAMPRGHELIDTRLTADSLPMNWLNWDCLPWGLFLTKWVTSSLCSLTWSIYHPSMTVFMCSFGA